MSSKLESDVCCRLQVAPSGESYEGKRRPGRKQGIWRDSLHVTCGLTACTPGSAPGPTLGNEYGKTLPLPFNLCKLHTDVSRKTGNRFVTGDPAYTITPLNPHDINTRAFSVDIWDNKVRLICTTRITICYFLSGPCLLGLK